MMASLVIAFVLFVALSLAALIALSAFLRAATAEDREDNTRRVWDPSRVPSEEYPFPVERPRKLQ